MPTPTNPLTGKTMSRGEYEAVAALGRDVISCCRQGLPVIADLQVDAMIRKVGADATRKLLGAHAKNYPALAETACTA